jgi:hypothetical protein
MFGILRGILVTFVAYGWAALAQAPDHTQQRQPTTASESTPQDFDFLLGSWDFVTESKLPGTPPKYPGRWTGERTGDGALVEDDYIVVDNEGQRRYLGVTIRAFDSKTKQWTTAFVVPPGANWSLGSAWREGNEIAEGPLDTAKGTRARFYDIGPDHFMWSMDRSTDGGKTWTNMVRVEAHRVSTGEKSK